jgi:hypothetical protein
MADGTPPRIKVFCVGLPDNEGQPTHERFDFPDYVRHVIQPAGRPVWLPGISLSEDGRIERRKQAQTGGKLRLDCPRCSFDEQRRMDAHATARLNELMERLYGAGGSEISARALVKYCWR